MQKALTMPMVLRAAVTAKRWLAKENRFATSIMEESVDNLHVKCGKHMFNNNFGRFRDFSSDFICGIANKMYLCSAIQENKQSTASVRASVIAPRCVGAFFSSSRYTYIIMYSLTAVFILINNFCSSEQRLVFLFGDTGYGSRFSAYKAKQENKMQKALTMPMVLRAAVTAKRWLAKENELVSIVMEERVDNLHGKGGMCHVNGGFCQVSKNLSSFCWRIRGKYVPLYRQQINGGFSVPQEHRSLLHIMKGLFLAPYRNMQHSGCLYPVQLFLLFARKLVDLFGDTGYGSRFSSSNAKQINKMQKALTMPMVLRAAVTAKRWLAKENEFCSAVMEEKVDNFHVVAVLECIIGIIMACFVMCNIFVAALGFALLAAGTSALARDEEVSAGV